MAQASANTEQTESWKSGKNRYVAAFLAWLLGIFGAHKFYIGQRRTGLLYLAFFWTAVPLLLGFGHAVHYLLMSNEEFHRRITMDEEDFEEWEEQVSEDSESPTKVGKNMVNSVKEDAEEGRQLQKILEFSGIEAQQEYITGDYDSPEEYVKEETTFTSWYEFVDREGGQKGEKEKHLDCEPQGRWVNTDRVAKVRELLDDDEVVHYMWRGGTIDVEGSSAGDSIFGNDRDRKSSFKGIFTAVTNKRIVIAIPQFLGDDERHIPYRSVTSVDLDTGVMAKRVSLQTKGQTYHIQAQGPSKDELRDAMKFIRQKVEEVHQPQQVVTTSEPDPTEQLQNLKGLHDDGVVSDEEFEEKRQRLLEKIE